MPLCTFSGEANSSVAAPVAAQIAATSSSGAAPCCRLSALSATLWESARQRNSNAATSSSKLPACSSNTAGVGRARVYSNLERSWASRSHVMEPSQRPSG